MASARDEVDRVLKGLATRDGPQSGPVHADSAGRLVVVGLALVLGTMVVALGIVALVVHRPAASVAAPAPVVIVVREGLAGAIYGPQTLFNGLEQAR